METIILTIIIAVVFLLVSIFGDYRYKWCSVIIFVSSLINIITYSEIKLDILSQAYMIEFLLEKERLIRLDGITAIALAFAFARPAFKQAFLLAFATLCHTMVLYDLTNNSMQISLFFFNWYEELIVLTGLLQMAAAHDGITSALYGIREHLYRIRFGNHSFSKTISKLSKRQKGKVRT
jgi:hypothetical protein